MHATEPLQGCRIVRDRGDAAMRDLPGVHEIGARNVEETPYVVIRFADRWVSRINDCYAINIEVIPVRPGGDRAKRYFPYVVLALCQVGGGNVSRNVGP